MFHMDELRRALTAATKRYETTARAHAAARDTAVEVVMQALQSGMAPTEVANLSPFTGAYIRRLARESGLPPARPGPKKPSKG